MRAEFRSKYAEKSIERRFGSAKGASLNTMLHHLMAFSSLPTLLRYEDRNSMRFSIESRTPFADDRRLIEAVFAIPSAYKIHNGYSKWLLREAMKDVLPEPIYSRTDKIGFATPETEWLTRNRKALDHFMDFLPSEVFDTIGLREAWSCLVGGLSSSTITQLWRYINMALWIKKYAISNIE
jgi:asparagine synthase (glutamine-hydrolysing)